MTKRPLLSALAGIALAGLAPLMARADIPAAIDRAPANSSVVFGISNVGKFLSNIESTAQSLGAPGDAMRDLAHFREVLKTPGINPDGSAAIIMPTPKAGADEDAEGGMPVIIAPISDYAAMSKALGGEGGAGVSTLKVEGKTIYGRDLTGGYAAISPDKSAVEGFQGKAGNGAAFEKLIGSTGRAIADSSDAIVIVNMKSLAPQIQAGMGMVKSQLEMMAAMSGGKADFEDFNKFLDNVARDGQATVVGLRKSDKGVRFDAALQCAEGSELAQGLNSPGKASGLTGTIPNQPFLFAAAVDASAPAVQRMFKNLAAAAEKNADNPMAGLNPLQGIEKLQGMSFFLGKPPSMFNGFLMNSATYIKTSDPKGWVANLKEGFSKINGKEVEGATYTAAYAAGGGKAGDKAVDLWTLKIKMDENNPMAAQATQMMSVLFGSTSLSGFATEAPGGVVMTYSKNSALLQQSLAAAGGDQGLNQDTGVKNVTDNLPADRVAEAFIGTKAILETVVPMMGLFNFNIPDDLPPVGLAATTTGGGARMTLFMPEQVVQTLAKLQKAANGGDEDETEKKPRTKDKAGQPKF